MERERIERIKAAVRVHRTEVAKLVPGELLHRGAGYIIILEGVGKVVAHKPVLVLICGGLAFVVYEAIMILTVEVERIEK